MNIASLSGVTKAVAALTVGGVLAGAIALGASGGKGAGSSPPVQVVAATATSLAEGTQSPAQVTATPYTQDRKPVPAILASQAGRPDCPQGWLVWIDTKNRFSICYPPTLPGGLEPLSYTSAIDPSDQVVWLHTPDQTNRDVSPVVLSLTASIQNLPAVSKDSTCVGLVSSQASPGVKKEFTYQGRPALSCEGQGEDFIQGRPRPLSVIILQVSLGETGKGPYVVIVAHYHSGAGKEESRGAVDRILETLAVR